MRLWTSQTIEFYNELMRNGIVYCTRVSEFAQENDFAYHWIAEQTRKRIGEPPIPRIKLPVWAWYQFDSKKKRKPPLSNVVKSNPNGKEISIEFEAPDELVLLSDFLLWHHPLNGWDLCVDKRAAKRIDEYFHTDFKEKPEDIQKLIVDSWDLIFDLDFRHKRIVTKHKKNRSIQATLWYIRKEWVISTTEY